MSRVPKVNVARMYGLVTGVGRSNCFECQIETMPRRAFWRLFEEPVFVIVAQQALQKLP